MDEVAMQLNEHTADVLDQVRERLENELADLYQEQEFGRAYDVAYQAVYPGSKRKIAQFYTALTQVDAHRKKGGKMPDVSGVKRKGGRLVAFWDDHENKWKPTKEADSSERKSIKELNGARGYR
jgi:hypothetical protein